MHVGRRVYNTTEQQHMVHDESVPMHLDYTVATIQPLPYLHSWTDSEKDESENR